MEYITFMLIVIFMLMVVAAVVQNEVRYQVQQYRTRKAMTQCIKDYSYSSSRVLVQQLDHRH